MTQTIFKTKIVPDTTEVSTCADCHKFKPTGEGRGRGLCSVFDKIVFSHHPFTQDCRLNFSSKSREKPIDSVGQQIQDTRLLVEQINHRLSLKNQLILKAPF